jgi:Protein of unknown function (DUF1592)/Protein of unknown function (DUF1588)/Protein of unknown function (DUF1595)/Protein of unknown function (DUF1587)/Protein of unknown function (DUF1585)
MAITYKRAYKKVYSSLLCLLLAPACTSGVAGPGQQGSGNTPGNAVPGGGSGALPPGTGSGGAGTGTGATSATCTAADQTQVSFRVLTRLNRAEYDNTARDLLGDTAHVALNALPADSGDGAFDNNADALFIDPSLTQKLSQVAETLAENALAVGSPGRKLVLTCQTTDDACAQQIAGTFAARAWRRPLAAGELDNLTALYKAARTAGFSFEQGVQTLVEGALMSPNFLFRPEIDPVADAATTHALSPYELATRLSYFLWSSMPDAALTASAASGELSTPAGVQTQVARMWASPNAESFFERFPGQWLHTIDLSLAPVPEIYPAFNPALQTAMEGETAHFMREVMTGDVDFMSFLDAKFTYVNAALAKFYGIPGQFGTDFTRVDLTGNTQRGGVLTQASFLTLTSAPERTSPVMRGQWVLARLLNAAPPAPPNNIPSLESEAGANPGPQTMRQKMVAHRTMPTCTACHAVMDPIGFGLENYDGIGQWRTADNGIAVDASGDLGGGKTFNGPFQLQSLLKSDPRVPRAVVQYLLSYALGRELALDPGGADVCLLDGVTAGFQTTDMNRMKALVARVATLPVVQSRRGAP